MEEKVKKVIEEVSSIEEEIDYLKQAIKETRNNQDEIFTINSEILNKLNEVHICLKGTEYDDCETNGHGGGMVRRLSKVESCNEKLLIWKTKISTRDSIIYSIVGAILAFISTVVITNWTNIFNKQ